MSNSKRTSFGRNFDQLRLLQGQLHLWVLVFLKRGQGGQQEAAPTRHNSPGSGKSLPGLQSGL